MADQRDESKVYDVIPEVAKGAHLEGMEEYKKMYQRSIDDPAGFFAEKARELLHWYRDFDIPVHGGFEEQTHIVVTRDPRRRRRRPSEGNQRHRPPHPGAGRPGGHHLGGQRAG